MSLTLLAQSMHLQPKQYFENRKQSQYSFKHLLRLQLHVTGLLAPALAAAATPGGGEIYGVDDADADADPPTENDPDADARDGALLAGDEKVGRVLKFELTLLLFAEAPATDADCAPSSENVATGAMAAAVAVSVASFELSDFAAASIRSCISSSSSSSSPPIDFDLLPFVTFALLLLLLPPPGGPGATSAA